MIKVEYREKQQAIFLRQKYRLNAQQISDELGIHRNTISEWVKEWPLTTEEIFTSKRNSNNRRVEVDLTDFRESKSSSFLDYPTIAEYKAAKHIVDPYLNTPNIKKGKASEHLFISRCLANNIDAYHVTAEDSRIDVIAGPFLRKCQVRTLTPGSEILSLRYGLDKETNNRKRFTEEDIDLFVAVDLVKFDVFVILLSDITHYKSSIRVSAIESLAIRNDLSLLTSQSLIKEIAQ